MRNKQRSKTLLIICCLFTVSLSAQDWIWERAVGTVENDLFGAITSGADAVYLGGSFEGDLTIGDSSFTSIGATDLLLTKLDATTGNPLWSLQAGGLDEDEISGMDVFPNEDLLLCGSFWDEISFGNYSINPITPSRAAFIARYDTQGEIVWAKALSGTGNLQANKVQVLANGDFALCGYFSNSISVDGQVLNAVGNEDLFVALFDPLGNIRWLKQAGLLGKTRANDVDVDADGNVYVAGQFDYELAFAGDTIEAPIIDYDLFLLKYDPLGNELWGMEAGGVFEDICTALEVDENGNAYLAGFFTRNLFFGSIDLHTALFEYSLFLAQIDSSGNPVWAKSIGTPDGYNYTFDLEYLNGRLLLPAYFRGQTQVDWAILNSGDPLVYDSFLASFNVLGELLWLRQLSGEKNIFAKGLSADSNNRVFIGGEFEGNLNFNATNSLNAGADFDLFLGALGNVTGIKNVQELNLIQVYPNPVKNTLYFESPLLETARLELLDLNGRVLQQFELEKGQESIQLPKGLISGYYGLKYQNANGEIYGLKIFIAK